MKELRSVKNMNRSIDLFSKQINKEYMKLTLQLLQDISIGEKLDFNKLKLKYIKKVEDVQLLSEDSETESNENNLTSNMVKLLDNSSNELSEEPSNESSNELQQSAVLLDKVIKNDTVYYVEKKKNGIVYNTKSEIVGYYKKNEIEFIS
jgi:hypothetical protein